LAQKLEISKLFISKGFSIRTVLSKAGVLRSTWYNQDKNRKSTALRARGKKLSLFTKNKEGKSICNKYVVELLKSYREIDFFNNAGGYRKFSKYLKIDFGLNINHKKVYRLCRENNLLLPMNKKKRCRASRISINRTILSPNKLWEFDIKYGYIHGEDRFFYLLSFIDVFSRKVVGTHIGLSCKAKDLVFTLKEALLKERISKDDNLVLRSDNGSQMTSNLFGEAVEAIKKLSIIRNHEFIPPSTPNKNAHIESFFSIIETELFQTRYFRNFREAYEKTTEFIDFYNNRRIHGSLRYQAPIVAKNRFDMGIREIKEVRV
jgi:putative transposase